MEWLNGVRWLGGEVALINQKIAKLLKTEYENFRKPKSFRLGQISLSTSMDK